MSKETKSIHNETTWPGFRNKADATAAGWTEEEIAALVNAPRTREASIGTSKSGRTCFIGPQVNGHDLSPFSSAFTADERKMYQNVRKMQRDENPEAQGTRPHTAKKLDPAIQSKWQKLLDANKDNPELYQIVLDLMPKSKDNILFDLTGHYDIMELTEPVSIHYMMFRGPNGQFADHTNLTANELAPLFADGWYPKYTKDKVEDMLNKLETRGIAIKDKIAA